MTSVNLLMALVALVHVVTFAELGAWGAAGFLALLLLGIGLRAWNAVPALLLFFLMNAYWWTVAKVLPALPAVPFLLPFLITAAIVSIHPATRKSLAWMRMGKMDRTSALLVVLTGVVSTGALLAWAFWTDQLGAGLEMVKGVAGAPRWFVYTVGVPVFALINALAEEVVYRGVLQESLERESSRPGAVWGLQATAFAAAHFAAGFPNGLVGYAMVFVYGLMLGYLRSRTRGMLAPYLAHVIADLCIGYFLVSRVIKVRHPGQFCFTAHQGAPT